MIINTIRIGRERLEEGRRKVGEILMEFGKRVMPLKVCLAEGGAETGRYIRL